MNGFGLQNNHVAGFNNMAGRFWLLYYGRNIDVLFDGWIHAVADSFMLNPLCPGGLLPSILNHGVERAVELVPVEETAGFIPPLVEQYEITFLVGHFNTDLTGTACRESSALRGWSSPFPQQWVPGAWTHRCLPFYWWLLCCRQSVLAASGTFFSISWLKVRAKVAECLPGTAFTEPLLVEEMRFPKRWRYRWSVRRTDEKIIRVAEKPSTFRSQLRIWSRISLPVPALHLRAFVDQGYALFVENCLIYTDCCLMLMNGLISQRLLFLWGLSISSILSELIAIVTVLKVNNFWGLSPL